MWITGEDPVELHARAVAQLFLYRPAQGVRLLESATQAVPDREAYWNDLAVALIAQGIAAGRPSAFRQAVTAADRAIALSPASPAAHFNRGIALEHLGDRDAAAASYRRALSAGLPRPWHDEISGRLH